MSEALSSFLVSVSIIIALALLIPCIEMIAGLLHRKPNYRKPAAVAADSRSESYSRETA